MPVGKIRAFTVSNTSQEVARKNNERVRLRFICNNATAVGVCVISDETSATTTNGFPCNGEIVVEGLLARRAYQAIRLSAADVLLGVIEEFPDDAAATIPVNVNMPKV